MMLNCLLSKVGRAIWMAGLILLAAAAPAQPPPTPTMICVCTTPTPVPTPAPTYTCIDQNGARTSEASPPDGAVYRVGEPVLIDTDPEYATGRHCPQWPFPTGERMIISRTVGQTGEDGIGINSFRDSHDRPVTLRFNVPGTVRIVREARDSQGLGYTLSKRNVITIIDDGPTIFPPPTPAPPPTGPQPAIRAIAWLGDPQSYSGDGVATRDGEVMRLVAGTIENTGTGDLVITDAFNWIYSGSASVWIKSPPLPMVIRPGQTRYFEYGMEVHDWDLLALAYVLEGSYPPQVVLVTNVPSRRFVPVGPSTPFIFNTAADIPEGYPFPPPIPVTDDPSICNDSNNDGHIDAGDIVHSLLGRE